ncbi:MAG: hypothetical protein K8I27_11310 [Planctomycetes bacterium]|nr:hypothetical protein [Planctomycetota bacterium]
MTSYEVFVIARALHVLGVVMWIGGVAFVTTVLIPSLRRMPDADKRLELFEKLEGRFSFQAKIVTVITGASGFYMVHHLDGWARFKEPALWWMHAMVLVWVMFTLVLFVLEPLFLHRWFHERAKRDPDGTFRLVHRMHVILLTLSLIAVAAAVAGVRGLRLLP